MKGYVNELPLRAGEGNTGVVGGKRYRRVGYQAVGRDDRWHGTHKVPKGQRPKESLVDRPVTAPRWYERTRGPGPGPGLWGHESSVQHRENKVRKAREDGHLGWAQQLEAQGRRAEAREERLSDRFEGKREYGGMPFGDPAARQQAAQHQLKALQYIEDVLEDDLQRVSSSVSNWDEGDGLVRTASGSMQQPPVVTLGDFFPH